MKYSTALPPSSKSTLTRSVPDHIIVKCMLVVSKFFHVAARKKKCDRCLEYFLKLMSIALLFIENRSSIEYGLPHFI